MDAVGYQAGMTGGRLLLTARQVAAELGLSERKVWLLNSGGLLPAPIRLGRSTRWRRTDVAEWVRAGCPAREKWQALQAEGGRA